MLQGSDVALARAFDVALVDLDGVAYRGAEPIDHAAASLEAARDLGMQMVFVTNNASREPESVADQLTSLGIPATSTDVMTAAQAAAAVLATRLEPGSRVLVVGGAGLRTAVRAAGLVVVDTADENPDAVVQGFAPEVSWRELAQAAYAVQRGAWYVASNRDLTLPNEHGLAPGNGALVAAVVAATGVEPVSAGKPEPTMYEMAVERSGRTRPLVVGDRLDTDLGGARAAGYPGLHVFTGVSSARDAIVAAPGERPTFLGADLRALLVPHAAPERSADGWWVCGTSAAVVRGAALELRDRGAPPTTDLVRAACAAVWDTVDGGAPFDPGSVPDLLVDEA